MHCLFEFAGECGGSLQSGIRVCIQEGRLLYVFPECCDTLCPKNGLFH
ncbi:protein of unknown function [Maridesulfovibrio hydrothermalis AM13 = DSM 14728]|uniref:Uncharacterized protein n=1 Tax=Maridesulfovibrio hydrothermalis AM13 = DSM 14728 TaxID=1121451 RepID=L0RF83_9BACT|nr:protein of unknown function [Maridesulfovibrio hydrothermalis AM13 = DSM 14728]